MSSFPAPTFTAAQGACLGVGLGLLFATDVVGLSFFDRLGAHKTLDLIYIGRLMTGVEAVESGLFSSVMPKDRLDEAVDSAARSASTGAPMAFRASKTLISSLRQKRLGLWGFIAEENTVHARLCATEDYREGFAAFHQKRTPEFRGV